MGLREAFQKGIKAGFSGLGNLPETVSFDHYLTTVYEVSAGENSATVERYFVTGVFSSFKFSETPYPPTSVDVRTDLKFISPRTDWPFEPTTQDVLHRLENEATVSYEVQAVMTDPAEATWSMQVRRKG